MLCISIFDLIDFILLTIIDFIGETNFRLRYRSSASYEAVIVEGRIDYV